VTTYLIIIEKAENNYAAYCPDLPGVIATGSTKEDTKELMKEAIEYHLEGLKAECLSIPEPTTMAESVEVTVHFCHRASAGYCKVLPQRQWHQLRHHLRSARSGQRLDQPSSASFFAS